MKRFFHLAVAPDAQRQGIGLLLVNAWVAEVKSREAPGCYLTTDAEDNEAINRFYARAGWHRSDTFVTPEGRRMNQPSPFDFAQGYGLACRYVLEWEEGGAKGQKSEVRGRRSEGRKKQLSVFYT